MRASNPGFPFDAPCPGIGKAGEPARDRIVSLERMGGGAFILLKAGRFGPETTKQAEIRFANLLKILWVYFGKCVLEAAVAEHLGF